MIARIQGTVVEKHPTQLVVDCHGVGYAIIVTVVTAQNASIGQTITLATHMAVREDAMQLFGFTNGEERDVFLQLTGISGIGGKTAIGILSAAPLAELRSAVMTKNTTTLQRLPGIGKKTAERIIVELHDKMSAHPLSDSVSEHSDEAVHLDAIAAMVALGYQRARAEKAVHFVAADSPATQWTVDALLRSALKIMQ